MKEEKDRILSLMDQYYYYLADKLPVRQDNIFRTYLWVSSLSLTTNALLLQKRVDTIYSLTAFSCGISILLAFLSLIYSLHSMRGKIAIEHPNLGDCLKLLDDQDTKKGEIEQEISEILWNTIEDQIKDKSERGQQLRTISWLLIISFCYLLHGAVFSINP